MIEGMERDDSWPCGRDDRCPCWEMGSVPASGGLEDWDESAAGSSAVARSGGISATRGMLVPFWRRAGRRWSATTAGSATWGRFSRSGARPSSWGVHRTGGVPDLGASIELGEVHRAGASIELGASMDRGVYSGRCENGTKRPLNRRRCRYRPVSLRRGGGLSQSSGRARLGATGEPVRSGHNIRRFG